jgi:cobalt-zinc-cadmium efflux system membrane fusion protein
MDMHEDLHEATPAASQKHGPAKGLPKKSQIAILLALLAIGGAAILFGVPGMPGMLSVKVEEKAAEEPAASNDGKTVTLTARQWGTVKIAPVESRVFQAASETDGKIAVDDDLVTPVFSPYTGRVTRLIAKTGDIVKQGDPLIGIDAGELAQGQNDLVSAAATLKTTKAQLTLAQTNEKRQHDLYQAQGAALKDWQQAQVDLANAQGGYNSAQIAVSAVRNRLRIMGRSDADIGAIESAADLLKVASGTVVLAPIAGTIVQRQVGLGQNIVSASAGAQSPIFQIGDLSKVWLIANAREADAPSLRVGDAAEVSVLAYPDKVFKARVTYVGAMMDPNTHRLPVRAEIDNTDGALKPEMLANFRIVTGADESASSVPKDAVVFEGTAAHVWVANPEKKTLEIRPVDLGLIQGGQIQVTNGLKAGEQIVVAGAVFIDRAASGD